MKKEEYGQVKSNDRFESEKLEDDDVPRSAKRGWSRLSITTEPVFFVVNFTMAFTSGITIDLLEDNVCYQNFNLTWQECKEELPLEYKSSIEAMTADVNMVNNIIQGACPVLLSLLIGPWSDTNGRKPFMKWALAGYATFYALWGLLSLIPNMPVMWFVIPAIPLSLSGGIVAILVCTWSGIADVYEEEERPLRLSILLFCGLSGSIVGNALAAKVFYASGDYGYQVVFFSSAFIALLALLYTIYIMKESVTRKVMKKEKFFDIHHLKSILVALLFRPRHRVIISLLTMAILSSEITANSGDVSMIYLVGKSEFSWTLGDYNLFSAVITIMSALSPIVGVWIFQELLHWPNYIVLSVFSFVMMSMNVLKAISVDETMFWISACGLKLASILGPCIDTEMSKIVHEKDLGKAFAFSSLIDALSPVLSVPVFTKLYKYLLPDKTLYVFFLKALLSSITFISSTILIILFTYYRKKFWNLEPVATDERKRAEIA